ncbi:hypothetical protein [Lysinibacillus sp. BPa_S21]|uniref:hypothetical protein n=1 Tax=Lysinibacillus sp. BPa_S21 TaxID=2932478 RepID=UPI0020110D28|nr:hypothetical protein [Lysinibacillus sp. BPa_S21]MCL1697415.1 hypothetical protein [Lysinibacillus sp. BPa_S21]
MNPYNPNMESILLPRRPQEALLCAKAKRQQQMFSVAKAQRQQQMFTVAKAQRQQQSAQLERKSTPRFDNNPKFYYKGK